MAEPRDYTDVPTKRDVRAMLTPVALGGGISVLLLLVYSVVR